MPDASRRRRGPRLHALNPISRYPSSSYLPEDFLLAPVAAATAAAAATNTGSSATLPLILSQPTMMQSSSASLVPNYVPEPAVDCCSMIHDVWAGNLEQEMEIICSLVEKYPYLSMDTEYPGVVVRPIGIFKDTSQYQYQTIRFNVDMLRIIQLGITFSDAEGNLPPGICTFQFNFKFSLSQDMFAQESIDLLAKSGINFQRHSEFGIDVASFGELLMASGMVLTDRVKWVSFHSSYDFAYMIKILTNAPLPLIEQDFFTLLRIYFPCLYDIKSIMRHALQLRSSGLQELANELQVERVGIQHQAGSDSLLTCLAFFKLRNKHFNDTIDDSRFAGVLFGLNSPDPPAPAIVKSISATTTNDTAAPVTITATGTAIASEIATSIGGPPKLNSVDNQIITGLR